MNDTLFIEPKALMEKLDKTNLKIFDATFYLPDSGLIAEDEYQKEHIPNSTFFDINKIADPDNTLPHMIPSKDLFSKMMQNLGLNNDDEIVIYDNSPFLSSARAWFLFRYFGQEKVSIMQGGLDNWKKCGGTVSNKVNNLKLGNYTANKERKELVFNLDQMIKASKDKDNVIDSFEEPEGIHFVCCINDSSDKILGVNGVYKNERVHESIDVWWLGWFYVLPSEQHKGIGQILFDQTLKFCKNRKDCRKIYVDVSSLPEYITAKRFYIKNGFIIEGILKDFYDRGEDQFVMGLTL